MDYGIMYGKCACLNDSLRDRFVCGLREESIQWKILSKIADLTLESQCRWLQQWKQHIRMQLNCNLQWHVVLHTE